MVSEIRTKLDQLYLLRGQLLTASLLDKGRLATIAVEQILDLLDTMTTEIESLKLLAERRP